MTSEELLQLEKDLSFESFENHDAFNIALEIIQRVKTENLKNVRIRAVLNGDIVFQYLMDGKVGETWLNRKQHTVETFKHSSYYVWQKNNETNEYSKYTTDENYAICGGGFPIIVNDNVVGGFYVSGLAHDEDHQLIVDAFRNYKNK